MGKCPGKPSQPDDVSHAERAVSGLRATLPARRCPVGARSEDQATDELRRIASADPRPMSDLPPSAGCVLDIAISSLGPVPEEHRNELHVVTGSFHHQS